MVSTAAVVHTRPTGGGRTPRAIPISNILLCRGAGRRKVSSLQDRVRVPTNSEFVANILALSSDRFTPAIDATSLMSSSSLQERRGGGSNERRAANSAGRGAALPRCCHLSTKAVICERICSFKGRPTPRYGRVGVSAHRCQCQVHREHSTYSLLQGVCSVKPFLNDLTALFLIRSQTLRKAGRTVQREVRESLQGERPT